MKKNDFKEYIKTRYEPAIEWYDSKAIANQKYYRGFQITTIILSFLTPLIIALNYDCSRNLSILVSSTVAILSTIIATFKFYENWVNYRTTCESLKKERNYHKFRIGPYNECEDKESLFVERVEDLISKEHSKWIDTQKKTEPYGRILTLEILTVDKFVFPLINGEKGTRK